MIRTTIAARRLISADHVLEYPIVSIEDGRVHNIETLSPEDHKSIATTHRFPEATLVPAYVDIHIHGCAGHDVMEATSKALGALAITLRAEGLELIIRRP